MQYSKKSHWYPHQVSLLATLLAVLLLICPLVYAQGQSFISGDISTPSSAADNSLIDSDTVASPPAPRVSPAEAAELVRSKVGGQVMSVSTQWHEMRVVYGVKVLSAGRMRTINVDGHTGQLLNY